MQYRTDSFQACYVFYSYIRRLTSSAAAAERRTLSSLLENYAENWARLGPAHTVHGLRPYLESERQLFLLAPRTTCRIVKLAQGLRTGEHLHETRRSQLKASEHNLQLSPSLSGTPHIFEAGVRL